MASEVYIVFKDHSEGKHMVGVRATLPKAVRLVRTDIDKEVDRLPTPEFLNRKIVPKLKWGNEVYVKSLMVIGSETTTVCTYSIEKHELED